VQETIRLGERTEDITKGIIGGKTQAAITRKARKGIEAILPRHRRTPGGRNDEYGDNRTNLQSGSDANNESRNQGMSRQELEKLKRNTGPFCQTLEIQFPLNLTEVKRAFRKLAIRMHPDKGGTKEGFQKLIQHYEKLNKAITNFLRKHPLQL